MLSKEFLNFWCYDHDEYSRDEMARLKYPTKNFLHLSIEDVHLENPNTIIKEKHENYLRKLKDNLFIKSQERRKFNFSLSDNRISKFGGKIIEELGSTNSTDSACNEKTISEQRMEMRGGMSIQFNWRLECAVRVSLPRDIATAAR